MAADAYARFDRTSAEADEQYQKRMNEIIRAGQNSGLAIVQMLDKELDSAWQKYQEMGQAGQGESNGKVLRGRIRGLAQAITIIRSPYTFQEKSGTRAWSEMIKATEDDSLRRVRARAKRRAEVDDDDQ